jgi:hypothetical protein
MGNFLPMSKDNKSADLFYRNLVTLRAQVFWEFVSAIRNVFTAWFRKLG